MTTMAFISLPFINDKIINVKDVKTTSEECKIALTSRSINMVMFVSMTNSKMSLLHRVQILDPENHLAQTFCSIGLSLQGVRIELP